MVNLKKPCKACGECELGWTGGICPVTMCAKGLINGACGGAKNGKCEVSPENDCAWIKIYEKLKELDQLENLARDKTNQKITQNKIIQDT